MCVSSHFRCRPNDRRSPAAAQFARGRLVQRVLAGLTPHLSAMALRSNIRAARAQSLQTLLDVCPNRGRRKVSKKPLQLSFNGGLVAACARRRRQFFDQGIDFLLCARSVAAGKRALEVGPRTICVDLRGAHAADDGSPRQVMTPAPSRRSASVATHRAARRVPKMPTRSRTLRVQIPPI